MEKRDFDNITSAAPFIVINTISLSGLKHLICSISLVQTLVHKLLEIALWAQTRLLSPT